ncbi:MAG: Ig-like domain-containing protein, partial [Anaerolineae bacterium]
AVMFATIPSVTSNHTISVSFEAFDQIAASDVSTKLTQDTRVLLIGKSTTVGRIKNFLEGQIAKDENIDFSVTIGTQGISQDLLVEYYDGRNQGPETRNALLQKIYEGWDYVIPIDLYDYPALLPELHLEGVRLIHNRAWFDGDQARLILPMLWYSTQSASYLDEIGNHTYRIGNGFRAPVLPVGYAWRELVQNHGLLESSVGSMSWEAAYLFASMLFDQFFERDVSEVGYTTFYIDEADRIAIEQVSWSTWQAEKTRTHYSGDYAGIATPFEWSGGRGYLFGTSTRERSVGRMNGLIASQDPGVGDMAADATNLFGDAAVPGSAVQNNLASRTYDYMWRQWKGEDTAGVLNTNVRGQFGQDPYFIWFTRYWDQSANDQASMIGYQAFWEASDALNDNLNTSANPNRKSRSPMTHIGWGRVWEERTDIQMMESDYRHAHSVVMSMFAAQTYALLTGRDASLYGTWEFDPGSVLGERAGYAQRVGYETIMQMGTLDVNEPYNIHQYDVPVFNQHSVLYPQAPTLVARDDTFSVEVNAFLDPTTIPAPGVLANDYSTQGRPLTAILSTDLPFGQGQLVFNPDGSFEYWPAMYGPSSELFVGTAAFSYVVSDGENQSKAATVRIGVKQALYLSKEAEPMDGVRYNDTVTYTLTISGAGQSATLWDPLPPNVSYVSDSLTDTLDTHAVYSPTAKAIVWEGALPADGAAEVIRFQATPDITGTGSLSLPIVNTAWLTDHAGTSLSATVVVNGYRTYLPLIIR